LNLGYGKGPLAFAAATQQVKSTSRRATQSTTTAGSETGCEMGTTNLWAAGGLCTVAAVPETDIKTTISIVAASYDMKVAKLFANYGRVKVEDSKSVNGGAEGKRDAYVLGAQVPMGKVQLFGLYSWGNNEMVTRGSSIAIDGTTISNGRTPTKRDVTGYTVGARYNMSKRTFAYAAVGETKLDANSTATSSPNSDREYGVKVQQTTVGLVHSF